MAKVSGDGPQGFFLFVHQPDGHVGANVMKADAADPGPFTNPLDQPAPLIVRFTGLGVGEYPPRFLVFQKPLTDAPQLTAVHPPSVGPALGATEFLPQRMARNRHKERTHSAWTFLPGPCG